MHKAVLLSAALLMPAACQAMTIDDLSPGKTITGPNLTLKDMKGKIVLVVFWGIN